VVTTAVPAVDVLLPHVATAAAKTLKMLRTRMPTSKPRARVFI
jgi:hypothetical protein